MNNLVNTFIIPAHYTNLDSTLVICIFIFHRCNDLLHEVIRCHQSACLLGWVLLFSCRSCQCCAGDARCSHTGSASHVLCNSADGSVRWIQVRIQCSVDPPEPPYLEVRTLDRIRRCPKPPPVPTCEDRMVFSPRKLWIRSVEPVWPEPNCGP